MVVIVLTACPTGLRGYLTRWLMEISPGVFTGHVSRRVQDLLWQNTIDMVKDGRAIMVANARNEQHLEFKVHRHDWVPTDFDGVELMLRPKRDSAEVTDTGIRPGWSNQAKWRMARRRANASK
jgi:CRISPR-associated protein Cas2